MDQDCLESPGPAAYEVRESFSSTTHALPKVTMSHRFKHDIIENYPAPNHYNCDMNQSTSSAYSIKNRYKDKQPELAPGPGQYKYDITVVSPKAPAVTLGIRHHVINYKNVPAPNTYEVTEVEKYKKRAPSCGILSKYPDYILENVKKMPAANQYQPNSKYVLRKSESFTLKNKYKHEKPFDTPGPGSYQNQYKYVKQSAPACALAGKTNHCIFRK